ncbi:NUDIX domain-containing protein [Micromonospora sp. CPCC 205711]|uniref:NUDIX hydrolase n=1 Tax=Micromonospora sp. CPCC 205547 TaxID=3122400 RepID=UPI002FEF20B4
MSTLTWAVAAVVTDGAGRVLLCRREPGGRWALPGGRLRRPECPVGAIADAIHAETGCRIEVADLVGIYHLTGSGCARPGAGDPGSPPDVLVHVFRARPGATPAGEPPEGCRIAWHDPARLPGAVTPVTRAAVADAAAGRAGVLRDLRPDGAGGAAPAAVPARPGTGSAETTAGGAGARTSGGATTAPTPRGAPAAGRGS